MAGETLGIPSANDSLKKATIRSPFTLKEFSAQGETESSEGHAIVRMHPPLWHTPMTVEEEPVRSSQNLSNAENNESARDPTASPSGGSDGRQGDLPVSRVLLVPFGKDMEMSQVKQFLMICPIQSTQIEQKSKATEVGDALPHDEVDEVDSTYDETCWANGYERECYREQKEGKQNLAHLVRSLPFTCARNRNSLRKNNSNHLRKWHIGAETIKVKGSLAKMCKVEFHIGQGKTLLKERIWTNKKERMEWNFVPVSASSSVEESEEDEMTDYESASYIPCQGEVQLVDLDPGVKRERKEERVLCHSCGRSFRRTSEFRIHERVCILGLDPIEYHCPHCPKSFRSKHYVNEHVAHQHNGRRPFLCDVCKMSFTTRVVLRDHMKTHTGEKPFLCDLCGEHFATLMVMRQHRRVHTGSRPYKCQICDYRGTQRASIYVHFKHHHPESLSMKRKHVFMKE
ncbi:unnamed protein product [Darwinula stevensoni]|uniref:C2H2-type domain-containing protein n=1 Tax=Darwinula stevensoni TaxID=69355 RepID=A0A7R9A2W8_9CRUS|nr:unnamed protein product [Darwinula stevensoni]CAG0880816.1 unnamed protein product [Darwinula stevensoni]